MKYLLDTNCCIRFLNGRSSSIKHHLAAVQAEDIVLCGVVKAELRPLLVHQVGGEARRRAVAGEVLCRAKTTSKQGHLRANICYNKHCSVTKF